MIEIVCIISHVNSSFVETMEKAKPKIILHFLLLGVVVYVTVIILIFPEPFLK